MTIRDRFSTPSLPIAALGGAIAFGALFLVPFEAQSACVQTSDDVECAGVDGNGFLSEESLNVHVQRDALVGNITSPNVLGRCPLSLPGLSLGPSSNIFNEGTVSTFGVCGFGIVADNGSTIVNTGAILTHDHVSYGILTGNNVVVRTSGRISTDYQGSSGIVGGTGMRVTVEAGGTINTTGIGATGIEVSANALVTNNGAIVTRGDVAFGISTADGSTVINNGSVETSANNTVAIQVINSTLTNAGRISSVLSGPAFALRPTTGVAVVGKDAHFINAANGLVEATHTGVRLDSAQDAAVNNAGRIEVFAARQFDESVQPNGAAIVIIGTSPAEVINTGVVVAHDGLPAVRSMGPPVTLSNGGMIAGDVLLAGGNDVFTYRAGSNVTGVIDFGAGEDLLIFQGGGALNTQVLNVELLSKSGTGDLVLTRDLAVRQQVNIFGGGGMVINPGVRLASPATGNLGLLRGAGTIDGLVTNSGLIAPGTQTSKGTLTITGAFQQFANGTLAVRLSPDGSSDRLIIGGPATFAGTLALNYEGTAFRDGQRFDVVASLSGSLSSTGKFTLAAPELAFLKAAMVTTASGGLAVEIDRLSYSTAGVTPAQQSVGRLFDRLQTSPPAALSATMEQLEFSSPAVATTILTDFTAEAPGGVQNLGLLTLERLAQGLRQRVPAETSAGHFAWARGFSSRGRTRGTPSTADFDLHGVMAGVDMAFGDTWLGIAAARTGGDFARGSSGASLDASLLALTAGRTWDDFGVQAAIAYGHGAPEIRRVRAFGGSPDTLFSKADSDLWSARLEATYYDTTFGPVTFSPHAGAIYNRVALSATDEERALAIRTSHDALNSLRARLGAGASGATGRIRPYGDLSLSVELLQRVPRISASLIGVPDSAFELDGDARRRLAVDAEAGIVVTITPELEGHVAGTMTANDLLAGRTLTAGLTYRW